MGRSSYPAVAAIASFTALTALTALTRLARAEPTTEEKALATTLFRAAKALLDEGRVPEACRKLEESQRLSPAGGTLLNLAVCHEREGRTASAWEEFREARAWARRDQRDDRVELADQHMRALEPQLSKLVVSVSLGAALPDIVVTLDGRPLGRAAWGSVMPVDPGDHTVAAEAPGMKPWSLQVTIPAGPRSETVSVPPLEKRPAAVPPAVTRVVPVAADVTPPVATRPTASRAPALVAGVVGIGGLAAGTYFGVLAIVRHGQSSDACTADPCSPSSRSFNDASKIAADASTVAFSVGLASLGLATYLWLSRSRDPHPSVSITPTAAPGQGSIRLEATF